MALLHTIWTPTGTEPRYHYRHVAQWLDLHPGWEHWHWDDAALASLDTEHREFYDDPAHWSPKSHPGQYRSNLARLSILWRYGGVYVDSDMQPLRNVQHVLDDRLTTAWEQQGRHINNAFLAAPAGHPAIRAALDGIPDSIRSQPRKRSTWQTGGHYLTPLWRDRDDVHVLDQHLVYGSTWRQVHNPPAPHPDALMDHKWANAQRREGLQEV